MNIKLFLKIIIGLGLIIILLSMIGLDKMVLSIQKMDTTPLIVVILLIPIHNIIKLIRWKQITKIFVKIPTLQLFKIYMIGVFFSSITPSKIGDIIRIRYIKKYGISQGSAFSLTFMDRLFDFIVIVFVAIIGLFLIPEINKFLHIWQYLFIVVVLIIISIYIVMRKNIFIRIIEIFVFLTRISKKLNVDPKKISKDIYMPFYKLKKNPRTILSSIILSIILWIILSYQSVLIFYSLGLNVSIFHVFIFICIGAIVGLIPITISGIGTRDAIFILLFSTLAIAPQDVIIMSLLILFFTQIIPAIIGLFIYISNKS